jgi:hypothetical protein
MNSKQGFEEPAPAWCPLVPRHAPMPQSHFQRNVFVYDFSSTVPMPCSPRHTLSRARTGVSRRVLPIWPHHRVRIPFLPRTKFLRSGQGKFRNMDSQGVLVHRDGNIVAVGNYYVVSAGMYPLAHPRPLQALAGWMTRTCLIWVSCVRADE